MGSGYGQFYISSVRLLICRVQWLGLRGLVVKMRIKSWDPVAEVWGAVVPRSGHRARIWDLGSGVQCLGMWD